jgi:uncharacterized membrane protein YbaN (DUF454 family)
MGASPQPDNPGAHNRAHDSPEVGGAEVDGGVTRNPLLRMLWLALGFFFTGLGFIGALLPVMPTTVFLLIAAFFFARSSPRFYAWLLSNPAFGPLIRDWRAGHGIPLRTKIVAVTLITLTIGSSIVFFVPSTVGKIILALVGVGVSLYLLTRPTKPISAPA